MAKCKQVVWFKKKKTFSIIIFYEKIRITKKNWNVQLQQQQPLLVHFNELIKLYQIMLLFIILRIFHIDLPYIIMYYIFTLVRILSLQFNTIYSMVIHQLSVVIIENNYRFYHSFMV